MAMTTLQMIDVLTRGGALSILILWALILIRDVRHQRTARLALAMIIGIGCYILATSHWFRQPNLVGLAFGVGAGSTAGFFWLFARSWFNEGDAIRPWHYGLVAGSVINVVIIQLTYGTSSPLWPICAQLFRFGMFAFPAAALWEAWRGRDDDLIEARRRMRLGMIGAVGAFVILVNVGEMAVERKLLPFELTTLLALSILALALGFCTVMFGHRQDDLFGPPSRASGPAPDPIIDEQLRDRLLAHMERDMPHRDETMTIAGLAAQLGEQEYRLRRLINGQLGHRNFSAFLNGYRLAEVKTALADPSQKDVPILTIALDAGFGSLGPFNRAFREAEGMTPSEFRGRAA
jgi:AraC-like DNA-binding protein